MNIINVLLIIELVEMVDQKAVNRFNLNLYNFERYVTNEMSKLERSKINVKRPILYNIISSYLVHLVHRQRNYWQL